MKATISCLLALACCAAVRSPKDSSARASAGAQMALPPPATTTVHLAWTEARPTYRYGVLTATVLSGPWQTLTNTSTPGTSSYSFPEPMRLFKVRWTNTVDGSTGYVGVAR